MKALLPALLSFAFSLVSPAQTCREVVRDASGPIVQTIDRQNSAREIRAHCLKHGVAFLLKQLGRNPSRNGKVFRIKDKHSGEWEERDESLRIREFPKAFHEYPWCSADAGANARPGTYPCSRRL